VAKLKVLSRYLPEKAEECQERPQYCRSAYMSILGPRTYRIQSRSVNHWTTTFGMSVENSSVMHDENYGA
jgi:hypothetical protein